MGNLNKVLFDFDELLDLCLDERAGLAHILWLSNQKNGAGVRVLGWHLDARARLFADLANEGALLADEHAMELLEDLHLLLVVVLLHVLDGLLQVLEAALHVDLVAANGHDLGLFLLAGDLDLDVVEFGADF